MPVPVPTRNPQIATRCHGVRMVVAASSATESTAIAMTIVRRMPMREAMAAQNGPIRP